MKKERIFVAISGGVDSAVAAALLKHRGYDIRGIFLREYDLSLPSAFGDVIECTQDGDRTSALAVAAALDIPFEEWDFRKEYERQVIQYMVREYKAGRTPNPDMMCNSVIKFGLFLKRALKEGADYIATGHYARIQGHATPRLRLSIARDGNKDQTYFLATLTQEQLRHCLFPIGNLLKSEVRQKARAFGLPNWNRKDSQGICFIGKLSMKGFLERMIPKKRGALMTVDGVRVGTHDGAWYFTIGQRHGIGFTGGGDPYYVVGKDIKKNIVYVDRQKPSTAIPTSLLATALRSNARKDVGISSWSTPVLFRKELTCTNINWISGKAPSFPFRCHARTRYRQPLQKCVVSEVRVTGALRVTFGKSQRAITPGQFVVFYKGRECLGSGIIQ